MRVLVEDRLPSDAGYPVPSWSRSAVRATGAGAALSPAPPPSASYPPVRPLNSMYDTPIPKCRLSDGQPFHCLIVGYNTTRVVAIVALFVACGGACGVTVRAATVRCCAALSGLPPSRSRPRLRAVDHSRRAELSSTLLRQGRQGRTSGLLARICHGSSMFVYHTIELTLHIYLYIHNTH